MSFEQFAQSAALREAFEQFQAEQAQDTPSVVEQLFAALVQSGKVKGFNTATGQIVSFDEVPSWAKDNFFASIKGQDLNTVLSGLSLGAPASGVGLGLVLGL